MLGRRVSVFSDLGSRLILALASWTDVWTRYVWFEQKIDDAVKF